jgi:hypothetical protein
MSAQFGIHRRERGTVGFFDKAKNEAEDLAEKDPNLTDKGLNELGQEANRMTGDRFGNQVNQGVQDAENWVGQQSRNQGQNQGSGYQDQNQGGYQDPNQGGYDPNQGQDQGGYQDPNQGGYDQNQGQDQGQNQGW